MEIIVKTKILRNKIEEKYVKITELESSLPVTDKQKEILIKQLGLKGFGITPNNVFNFYYNTDFLFDILEGGAPLIGDLGCDKSICEYVYEDIGYFTLSELSKEEFETLTRTQLFVKDQKLDKILGIDSQGVFEQHTSSIRPGEPYFKTIEGVNVLSIFYHNLKPLECNFTLSL